METVLISGGTGMVGTRLTKMLLGKGYEVIVLTRKPGDHPEQLPGLQYAQWDIGTGKIDRDAVAKADHIIHLAGEGVADKRWTDKRKQQIVQSRTASGELLVRSLESIPNKVKTVVSASAIGWYGPDTSASRQKGFQENAPADTAFLGDTCRLWEASIGPVQQMGKRLVILRTGIVLSPEGGALQAFRKPLKAGVAAILGDGSQMVSWIQLDDLCRIYVSAIENTSLTGVYNAVAPHPVTNKELTLTLAKRMRGNYFIPVHVPVFVLKAMMGEMSIEVLKSATVSSGRIESAGYDFLYRRIEEAVTACDG